MNFSQRTEDKFSSLTSYEINSLYLGSRLDLFSKRETNEEAVEVTWTQGFLFCFWEAKQPHPLCQSTSKFASFQRQRKNLQRMNTYCKENELFKINRLAEINLKYLITIPEEGFKQNFR